MSFPDDGAAPQTGSRLRAIAAYVLELAVICALYFALAKLGLALASIKPNATPIWPPTGLALAAVLLRGYRVAPAILLGAFLANITTHGAIAAAAAIGVGNTLEAVTGAWLANRWSGGSDSFAAPAGVARFALFSFLATTWSPTIGVTSLLLSGLAEWHDYGLLWLTWWLGNLAGALVITPAIVLWAKSAPVSFQRPDVTGWIIRYAGTCVIGAIAFSPLIEQTAQRAALGSLAILLLLWSALRWSQRDTATVVLILSMFAVWSTLSGGGPFAQESVNESVLLTLMFMISMAVPSLALSADAAVRRKTEEELRRTQDELNLRVETRTAAMQASNRALQEEIDDRRRVATEPDQQTKCLEDAQRLANLGS